MASMLACGTTTAEQSTFFAFVVFLQRPGHRRVPLGRPCIDPPGRYAGAGATHLRWVPRDPRCWPCGWWSRPTGPEEEGLPWGGWPRPRGLHSGERRGRPRPRGRRAPRPTARRPRGEGQCVEGRGPRSPRGPRRQRPRRPRRLPRGRQHPAP